MNYAMVNKSFKSQNVKSLKGRMRKCGGPRVAHPWYIAIRISSFTRRRHLLSFCHQIALRNSPTSCQWRSQFQIIWIDVRVKTRPEIKMTLEDSNII
jgi:hypothetical protein